MKTTTLRSLFDVQVATKLEIEGLENHDDIINVNILMATIYLSQLLPTLGLQSVSKKKMKPETVLTAAVNVLKHVMLLANACNYEIPNEEELAMFEVEIPGEVKNDAVLTVLGMIGALVDIAHIVNVDLDSPIWGENEIPEDFEDDMFTIIIGLKNLGIKYNYTMNDVLAELVT